MNDLVIKPDGEIVEKMTPESLLSLAITKGASIDTIERLMALRKEVLAERAKEAFNAAMARFQAECPIIEKTKQVKNRNGMVLYSYAPIESIVDQVKHLLEEHGFRYLVTIELNGNNVKAICKVVHELGHEEVSAFEAPLGNKTEVMSQTQVVAAASTFAKRYAFLNAFGILTGDEDNDAKPLVQETKVPRKPVMKKPPTVTDVMVALTEAENIDKLNTLLERSRNYQFTSEGLQKIQECYNSCLAKFTSELSAL